MTRSPALVDRRGDAMYRNVITCRIRLTLSDDPHSRVRLQEALADQPVSAVRLVPRGIGRDEMTAEVTIELVGGQTLGAVLDALRVISPRVYLNCGESPAPPAASQQVRASS